MAGSSGSGSQFCWACGAQIGVGDRFCGECGEPAHRAIEAPSRRRRWWWVTVGVVVALGAVAAVGVAVLMDGRDSGEAAGPAGVVPDPVLVDLPAMVGDVEAVRGFVEGQGSDLIDFHTVTAGLLDLDVAGGDAVATCRSFVQDVADVAESPGGLLELAAAVPDETTALLLVNDIAAKRDLLAACVSDDRVQAVSYLAEVRFTHVLVARRLTELGIEMGADG